MVITPEANNGLLPKWVGPLEIVRRVGRLSYEIRDPKTKSEPKRVHACHLKPFVTPLIDKNVHPSVESVEQEDRGAGAALTQAPVVAQQVASDGNKAKAPRDNRRTHPMVLRGQSKTQGACPVCKL